MKRGKNIRSILLSIIAASIILTPIIYVQANKRIYANRVTRYLVEEKHYRKDEIQSVKESGEKNCLRFMRWPFLRTSLRWNMCILPMLISASLDSEQLAP